MDPMTYLQSQRGLLMASASEGVNSLRTAWIWRKTHMNLIIANTMRPKSRQWQLWFQCKTISTPSPYLHVKLTRLISPLTSYTQLTMSASFSSLPIISISDLSTCSTKPEKLSHLPARHGSCPHGLTYTHQDVFRLCDEFFGSKELSMEVNIKLRGMFLFTRMPTHTDGNPSDPLHSLLNWRTPQLSQVDDDNLKVVNRFGSLFITCLASKPTGKFNLIEQSVFPLSKPALPTWLRYRTPPASIPLSPPAYSLPREAFLVLRQVSHRLAQQSKIASLPSSPCFSSKKTRSAHRTLIPKFLLFFLRMKLVDSNAETLLVNEFRHRMLLAASSSIWATWRP